MKRYTNRIRDEPEREVKEKKSLKRRWIIMKQKGKKNFFKASTEQLERLKNVQGYDWMRAAEQKEGVTVSAVYDVSDNRKPNTGLKLYTVEKANAVVFTNNEQGSRSCFLHQNIAALGRSTSKPNLFVFDSTRELYGMHAETLKAQGYKVSLLDFSEPHNSDKWNPFAGLIWRVKQIRELENELENRDGKYYANGEEFYTYKKARERLAWHWITLYKDISDLADGLVNGYPFCNEPESAKIFAAFLCAMCEDCVASKLCTSQLLLTNVFRNIEKYCSTDYRKLEEYIVDKRNKNSQARKIMNTVFSGKDKEAYLKLIDLVYKTISKSFDENLEILTSESTIDLFTEEDEPKAIFVVSTKVEDCRNHFIRFFFKQASTAESMLKDVISCRMDYKAPENVRSSYFIVNNYSGLVNIPYEIADFAGEENPHKLILISQSYEQLIKLYGEGFGDWIKSEGVIKMFLSADDIKSKKEYYELCCVKEGTEEQSEPTKAEIEIFDQVKGVGNAVVAIGENPPCPTHYENAYNLFGLYCPEGGIKTIEREKRSLDAPVLFDIGNPQKE